MMSQLEAEKHEKRKRAQLQDRLRTRALELFKDIRKAYPKCQRVELTRDDDGYFVLLRHETKGTRKRTARQS